MMKLLLTHTHLIDIYIRVWKFILVLLLVVMPERHVFSIAARILIVGVVTGVLSAMPAGAGKVGEKMVGTVTLDDCEKQLGRGPGKQAERTSEPISEDQIAHDVSDFVAQATAPEQRYFPPSTYTADDIKRFQCGWLFASLREYDKAATVLDILQYKVIVYASGKDQEVAFLRERKCAEIDSGTKKGFEICSGDETYPRGWGLYILRKQSQSPTLAVEVPHPCELEQDCQVGKATETLGGDTVSHQMGTKTFNCAKAKFLLIAGTRRNANTPGVNEDFSCKDSNDCACVDNVYCADMAHQWTSIFEGVHEMIVEATSAVRIYQPHGFVEANHVGCKKVVVSGAAAPTSLNPTMLAQAVKNELVHDPGVVYTSNVLLYGEPASKQCAFGSARNNMQAVVTGTKKKDFLSVEAGDTVRKDMTHTPSSWKVLSDSVAKALGTGYVWEACKK
jgi:hypothetical protein